MKNAEQRVDRYPEGRSRVQRTDDKGKNAEDRGPRAEDRGRGQRTEDRGGRKNVFNYGTRKKRLSTVCSSFPST